MTNTELRIDGLEIRLRPSIRVGQRRLTYFDVKHNGIWLGCGDPMHGSLRGKDARAALAHYARIAIRDAA
jgi:hypothetical protein